jgi:hypothetical protein
MFVPRGGGETIAGDMERIADCHENGKFNSFSLGYALKPGDEDHSDRAQELGWDLNPALHQNRYLI